MRDVIEKPHYQESCGCDAIGVVPPWFVCHNPGNTMDKILCDVSKSSSRPSFPPLNIRPIRSCCPSAVMTFVHMVECVQIHRARKNTSQGVLDYVPISYYPARAYDAWPKYLKHP